MNEVPYIIYKGTLYFRDQSDEYEVLPTYDGSYPDVECTLEFGQRILDAVEKNRASVQSSLQTRFCLVTFDAGATYEAMPGWGVVAGNIYGRKMTDEDLYLVLNSANVEALAFVNDEGDVQYVTSGENAQMSNVRVQQDTTKLRLFCGSLLRRLSRKHDDRKSDQVTT